MREPLLIRLEVEGMRREMVHALQQHHADVERAVDDACKRFIDGGELDRQVRESFARAVTSEIENYFSYGDGRKAIQEAVKQGLAAKFSSHNDSEVEK